VVAAFGRAENAGYDINSFRVLFALLLVHTIGPQTIIILPALVNGYVEQLGFSERDAGFLATIETSGMFVAAVAMTLLVSRLNWRMLMGASLVAMVLANLASILADNILLLYMLRFVAGLGGGIIVVVSYAMIGLTLRKNRNFGWALFFVLLYGAIVFPIIPIIYARLGIGGAFLFFAAFALCGLPVVRNLPGRGKRVAEGDPNAINLPFQFKGMAVATMLLYFIGQMAVWTYFARFGIRFGISEQAVGNALSISQFFGLAGAFSVVVFSRLIRKDVALLLGIGLSIGVIAFLFGTHAFLGFMLISGAYQFLWNMTHPYLLGALATFDPSGRVIVYGTAMQFLGVSVGPLFAASLVTEESLGNVLLLGMVCMFVSLATILPPVRRARYLVMEKAGPA